MTCWARRCRPPQRWVAARPCAHSRGAALVNTQLVVQYCMAQPGRSLVCAARVRERLNAQLCFVGWAIRRARSGMCGHTSHACEHKGSRASFTAYCSQVDTTSRKKNLTMAERALFDAGQLSKRGYDKWRLERGAKLEASKYAARNKRKLGRV